MKKLIGYILTVFIFIFGFLSQAFSGTKMIEQKSLDPKVPTDVSIRNKGLTVNAEDPEWKGEVDLEEKMDPSVLGKIDDLEDKKFDNLEILSEDPDEMIKTQDLEGLSKFDNLEKESTEDWRR
jgi:hypothetical protein